MILITCLLALTTRAEAQVTQNSNSNVVYLEQKQPVLDLKNKAMLFYPKVGSQIDIKNVMRLYRSNSSLFTPAGALNSVTSSQSVFVIIPVVNSSNTNTWVLKFKSPDLFPGFSFGKIKLWNAQNGATIPLLNQSTNSVTFSLLPKTSKPILVELDDFQGLFGSFSLELSQAGASSQQSPITVMSLIALSIVISCFLLMIYLNARTLNASNLIGLVSTIALSGCLLIFIGLSSAPFMLSLIPLLYSIFLVCQGLLIRNSWEHTPLSKLTATIALSSTIIIFISALLHVAGVKFEILAETYSLGLIATFLAFSIASLLHFFATKQKLFVLIATIILAIISLFIALIYKGLLPASDATLNAFSYASVFLLIASLWHTVEGLFSNTSQTKAPVTPKTNSALSKKVQEVKDSYDHARLLQVLESERAAMKALQERENSQVDAMRRAKQEADEANNAKSAFLAMVSHEIRTPMTGVLGMVRFLKNTSLDATQIEHVDTIEESGNTIMSLLNDILDFEKVETGQMTLETIDFDLHRLMESIYSLARGYAADKNLKINLNIDNSIPKIVKGDPTRLRQVLLNLINNAIKFTQNGSVSVTLRPISSQKNESQIYFAVEDTGIGIEKETQANLFNPFKQADKSTSRKYGGSGLGLAISQKLVGLMGGTINIKSSLGEGSTFFFTLPLPIGDISNTELVTPSNKSIIIEQPTAIQTSLSNHIEIKHTHRALIVEDNAINQKVVSGFISEKNFDASIAGTGEEAITILQNDTNFDVILMDIEMPGISGVEATQRIRGELGLPAKAFPIIALTGNTQPNDIQNYLNAGMTGFLAKPIDADALHAILDQIKDGNYVGEDGQTVPKSEELPKNTSEPKEGREPEIVKSVTVEPQQADISTMNTGLSLDDEEKTHSSVIEFDEAQLASLKNTLKEADLKDMIDELIEKMHSISHDIKTAITDEHYDLIKAKGHEIKGMCANFGLTHVANQAEILEKTAQSQDKGGVISAYKSLSEAVIRGEQRLKTWMTN